MKPLKLLILVFFILSSANLSFGQGDAGQAGEFLRYGVGARALGMRGAYTALSEDGTAIYWNPAGLGQLDQIYLHFMSNKLYLDSRYEHFAFALPLRSILSQGSDVTLGLAYIGLGSEGFERRDAFNVKTGEFSDRQWALMLPVSYDYISSVGRISVGSKFTYFKHSLAGYSGTGNSLDFGILAQLINPPKWTILGFLPIKTLIPWRFGMVLRMPSGETPKGQKEDYPKSLHFGVSNCDIRLPKLPGRMILSYELTKILSTDRKVTHSIGGEYQLASIKDLAFGLRAGMLLNGSEDESRFSWGIGMSAGNDVFKNIPLAGGFGIDFGQRIHPYLGSSGFFSITLRLTNGKENVTRLSKSSDFSLADERDLIRILLKYAGDPRRASVDKVVVDSTEARYKDGEGISLETGVAEELMFKAEFRNDINLANRYDDFIGGLKRDTTEQNVTLEGYRWLIINKKRSDNIGDLKNYWRGKWNEHVEKWINKRNKLKKNLNVDALRMYLTSLLLVGNTTKVRYEIENDRGIAKQNKNFTPWDRKYFFALANMANTDSLQAAIAEDNNIENIIYIKTYLKLLLGFRSSNTGILDEVIQTPEANQFALGFLPPTPLFPDGLLVDDALLIKACLLVKDNRGNATELKRALLEPMYRYPGTSAFEILNRHLDTIRKAGSDDDVQNAAKIILGYYEKVLTPNQVVWPDQQ